MPQIAIIDDNIEQSGTLQKTLTYYLKKFKSELSVITQYPFKNIEHYFDFINKTEVCVLILDERLNDQSTPEGGTVSYKGNELVIELRKRLKDFPIFMVTAHSNDSDLLAKESQFEFLFNREDITVNVDTAKLYVPRIIRSAQRFLDSNNKELNEFNELTKLIAAGNDDSEKIARLKALQVKLEIPISGFKDRKDWLDAYEKEIVELEEIKKELLKKLGK